VRMRAADAMLGLDTMTPRDDELVAAIRQLSIDGETPSIRGLAAAMGVGVSATHRRLLRLRDRGFVTWEPWMPGTIRVAPWA
jgi:Mn-dependent DtxR family transcriptional regulator